MSDTGNMSAATPDEPESGPPELPPVPPGRNGCMIALMVVIGVILLLPGLCAIIFGGMMVSQGRVESSVMPFVVVGLTVGLFGVLLIWAAFRRPRP
jgi:hypothetical protein